MSAYSKQSAQKRPPGHVERVPLTCFVDTWEPKVTGKLGDPHPIGLRILGDGEMEHARSEARKVASRHCDPEVDPDGWVEAFNDAMIMLACAFGCTRSDDVTAPFFQLAEETVFSALTTDGARYIWNALIAHAAAKSPLEEPIDAAGARRLVALIEAGALVEGRERGSLDAARIARRALDMIERYAPDAAARVEDRSGDVEREDVGDDGVPVVTIRARR